jgi:hypothetical protein
VLGILRGLGEMERLLGSGIEKGKVPSHGVFGDGPLPEPAAVKTGEGEGDLVSFGLELRQEAFHKALLVNGDCDKFGWESCRSLLRDEKGIAILLPEEKKEDGPGLSGGVHGTVSVPSG